MENKHLTREEIAAIEVGNTDISVKNQRMGTIFFLIFISSVSLIQIVSILLNSKEENYNTSLQNVQISDTSSTLLEKMIDFNKRLNTNTKEYEASVEDNSVFRKAVIPVMQAALLRVFRTGNENAWVGKNNLYFKSANSYITNAGFLEEKQLEKRKAEVGIQPNPIKAIVDFNNQLRLRGIKLMILPAPSKASFLVKNGKKVLNNKSYSEFIIQLQNEGVIVCDLFKLLENQSLENSGFLKYDTHWSPDAMKIVSKEVCRLLDSLSIEMGNTNYASKKISVQNYGDIADMLNKNNASILFEPQSIEIEQISENNFFFKPSKESDILFLGDSYSNIYSLESMNWGTSAGLTEHISKNLSKPIDRILMNDAGAFATRLSLSNEMKQGKDRLIGKKVVIWEFADRELSLGDWKMLAMKLNENFVSNFFVPELDSSYTVKGIIRETSKIPIPGTVPYKDHVLSVHISDLKDIHSNKELGQSVVYLLSIENNELTNAAQLQNGQEVILTLYNWHNYSDKFGSINRSDLQDDDLYLEEPCWGVIYRNIN